MGWFTAGPELVWRLSVSIGAISFLVMAVAGAYFLYKRPDFGYSWLGIFFVGSLLATAVARADFAWRHVTQISPALEFSSLANGLLSFMMAVIVLRSMPAAIKMVSSKQLESVNRTLTEEAEARKIAEARMQKMLESHYVASETRLHTFFETASQAIIVMNADLRIQMVNYATEVLLGYHRSELIGAPVETLWPARLRVEYRSAREREFAEQNGPKAREETYLCKDGTEFLTETALSFVDTEDGPLAFTMVTDLTERRRAAEELARANRQLRSYLEAASQAIVAISKDGRILLVNRRTEDLFGYTRDELLGSEIELLLPPAYRQGHAAHRLSFFGEPRVRPMGPGMELAGLRKDGVEFPLEIGLSFVETDQGILALGMISDITERKRAADQLSRAHNELVRSNTELEQFAYSASHDLQEPLRMVTGYLNLLDRRYCSALDEDGRDFIRYAVDGASRMKGLIQDLLSVSRISSQAVNMHSSSADLMLKNALDNLTIAIEESGAMVTSDALPEVLADGALLTLVFQNLIGNAIKFHGEAPPNVHVSVRREGRHWIFAVRDNGIGIEPQHSERIFRIFERLNDPEKYSGTGIGLAITQRIVARHGGKIWVESHIGQGSTFFFAIPVGRKPA